LSWQGIRHIIHSSEMRTKWTLRDNRAVEFVVLRTPAGWENRRHCREDRATQEHEDKHHDRVLLRHGTGLLQPPGSSFLALAVRLPTTRSIPRCLVARNAINSTTRLPRSDLMIFVSEEQIADGCSKHSEPASIVQSRLLSCKAATSRRVGGGARSARCVALRVERFATARPLVAALQMKPCRITRFSLILCPRSLNLAFAVTLLHCSVGPAGDFSESPVQRRDGWRFLMCGSAGSL